MDINPLLDRLMNVDKEDVVHSSAYAKTQNIGRIGSDSVESFEKRREIDQNRTRVQGYGYAKVANDTRGMGFKASKYDANKDASQRGAIRERFGSKRTGGVNEQSANGADFDGGKTSERTVQPPARRNPGIFR